MYREFLSPCVSLSRIGNAHLLSSSSVCPRHLSCCVQSVVAVSYPDTHLQCCSIMSSVYVPPCLSCLLFLMSRQCMSSTSCKKIFSCRTLQRGHHWVAPFLKPIWCIRFKITMLWFKVAGTRISSHIISVVFPIIKQCLGAFEKLRNATVRFVIRPSVRPHGTTRLSPNGFL